MPYLTWKTIGKKKRLVLRWNKRINGKSRVVKEIYIGDMENLAKLIEQPIENVEAYSLSYGVSAAVTYIDNMLDLTNTINRIMNHKGKGISPGDYVKIFIANRLSDPRSKNGIEKWLKNDILSTIYPEVSSQKYWNMMERFTERDIDEIWSEIQKKLKNMADFSKIIIDASNIYTFMEENEIAKKGYNKKHRYDLNQISYYIAANYDYIPYKGNAYPGNVFDSKTFQDILVDLPEGILVYDKGYNSYENVKASRGWKYIGSLRPSDHSDILDLEIEKDFIEFKKDIYGMEHRIIVYKSESLFRREYKALMKLIAKTVDKCKEILSSDTYDKREKALNYLETVHLQETIMINDNIEINENKVDEKIRRMGKEILFTNIMDIDARDIIELYKKRGRIEQCFRTINVLDLASPIYHFTPDKIRVHMFFSLLSFLFLALLYNKLKGIEGISLANVPDYLSNIRAIYIISGDKVKRKIEARDEISKKIIENLDLEKIL